MDLAVAVGAASVEETTLIFRISGSVNTGVTLGAEPRHAHFKQAVINGPVGFMAVGAIIRNRRMLMKEGPSPFRMTGVTVLVNAVLFELCRIGRAVRVVAVRADDLALSHGHVRRAHQLRFSLQVALTAHFYFGSLVEERSFVVNLGKLIFVARLLHYCVAVDTCDAAARVRARLPVGLNAALMTRKADLVLDLGRLSRIFSEADESPFTPAPTGGHMVASRAVTGLAGLPFFLVASVEEKNLSHHGFGKLFKLRGVAGLTNIVADIGCLSWFGSLRLRRPDDLRGSQQHSAEKTDEQ
jgi:hypothetical protein